MKKLILENTTNPGEFKITKGVFKTKSGKEIPCYYLKGNTYALNQVEKISDKYGCIYDRNTKSFVFWEDRTEPQLTPEKKIKPLIQRINSFYNINLEIDKMVQEMETQTEAPSSDSNELVATKEQTNQLASQLKSYQDQLNSIQSDEEFKDRMAALIDFRRGQGTEYSMGNTMLIMIQNPNATNVNSVANWKNAFNRTINEGAKPIFIRRPVQGRAKFSTDKKAEQDYLQSIGKTSKSELRGGEVTALQRAIFNARPKSATVFEMVAHYDVADTTQIEGTEDYVAKGIEAAKKVDFSDVNAPVQNIVSDEIKPIYKGLVEFAEDLRIGINSPSVSGPSINVPQNAGNDAKITKNLAQDIFKELLHKTHFKNQNAPVGKLYVGGEDEQIKAQQAELASWLFLRQYGIDFKTSRMDMSKLWGNDPKQIEFVANTVQRAVNKVIDFVNNSIKKSKSVTEMEGEPRLANHITTQDVIQMMGAEKAINQQNLQELHKRLLKKVLR